MPPIFGSCNDPVRTLLLVRSWTLLALTCRTNTRKDIQALGTTAETSSSIRQNCYARNVHSKSSVSTKRSGVATSSPCPVFPYSLTLANLSRITSQFTSISSAYASSWAAYGIGSSSRWTSFSWYIYTPGGKKIDVRQVIRPTQRKSRP